MDQFSITYMILVPPMIVAILNTAAKNRKTEAWVRQRVSTVQAVVAGAAPLDAATQVAFQALLPDGSTCTQLRGPIVIRRYLDNPEANQRDWGSEGYFHGRDIMYRDTKTGLSYVVDRKKELIKVRGFQVAPNEIEGVLLSHPAISDAAVIGVRVDRDVEAPRAYIVRTAGSRIEEAEVMALVAAKLARYKQLVGGVRFVDSIPKIASGKILRRVLREEAKREMGSMF